MARIVAPQQVFAIVDDREAETVPCRPPEAIPHGVAVLDIGPQCAWAA
jgi:hypothetical protein